ncbi:PSPA7_2676 family Cys-rich small protein [Pseudomonas entomophila]|uniref:PSPA7_2676 family Cys-rich small protein n=1 Tax=Pseudomonas entomophila TaxID=312306 RepID=UPI0024BFA8DC|nr:PSPA7_2676 family Cys-rich small protein [Pseudomonas entomophila]
MKLVCLLRGCQWRTLSNLESSGLACLCCGRCGALRYKLWHEASGSASARTPRD